MISAAAHVTRTGQAALAIAERTVHTLTLLQQALDCTDVLQQQDTPQTATDPGGQHLRCSAELLWALDDLARLWPAETETGAVLRSHRAEAQAVNRALRQGDKLQGAAQARQEQAIATVAQELQAVRDRLLLQSNAGIDTLLAQPPFSRVWQAAALLALVCVGFAGWSIWYAWRRWHGGSVALQQAIETLASPQPATARHRQLQADWVPSEFGAPLQTLRELLEEGDQLALAAAHQAFGQQVSRQWTELARTIPGVVFQYEYLPDGTRQCHLISPKAAVFFGCPTQGEAQPGHEPPMLPAPPQDDAVPLALTRSLAERIAQHADEAGTLSYDTRVGAIEGPHQRWIRTLANLTRQRNGHLMVYGVWLDVSERIEHENALAVARQQAEQIAEEKVRLLAVMSHEIRTPLNGVLGMTQLALKDQLPARQRERLNHILNAGQHLMEIVNDVLDFSKIESGQLHLENTAFSLQKLVADVAQLLAPRAAEKGLEFWIDAPHALHDELVGDPYRIRQILINFLANAVKFTPAGEVSIRVRQSRQQRSPDLLLTFEVHDTGIGIAPEHQRDIFEAFRQADVSTTRRYGGTGLGLAISSRFAKLLGGTTGLRSSAGKGSVFWFTAQVQPVGDTATAETTMEARRDAAADTWLHGKRVLVIESHARARQVVCAALRDHFGCSVASADSGRSATTLLQQHADQPAFDVCLLTARLADCDATQLLTRLQTLGLSTGRIWLVAPHDASLSPPTAARAPDVARVLHKPLCIATLREAAQPQPESGAAIVSASATETVLENAADAGATAAPLPNDGAEAAESAGAPPWSSVPVTGPLPEEPSLRILVVDDNALNRTIAVGLLQGLTPEQSIAVDCANDGAAAIQAVTEGPHRFDAVLMDLQMPVLDGYSATRAIRAHPRGAVLPIFAMSAHRSSAPELAMGQECGISDFVHKPVMEAQLRDVLTRWQLLPEGDARPTAHATAAPVAAAPSAEPCFEPAAWQELQAHLPAERALTLAQQFLEQSQRQWQDLTAALQQQRWSDAQALLHTLSGTAGSFGLVAVGPAADRLSAALRASPQPSALQWQTPLSALEQALMQGRQRLQQVLVPAEQA